MDSPTVLIAEKTSMPISAKENGSIALIIRIAAKIAARVNRKQSERLIYKIFFQTAFAYNDVAVAAGGGNHAEYNHNKGSDLYAACGAARAAADEHQKHGEKQRAVRRRGVVYCRKACRAGSHRHKHRDKEAFSRAFSDKQVVFSNSQKSSAPANMSAVVPYRAILVCRLNFLGLNPQSKTSLKR